MTTPILPSSKGGDTDAVKMFLAIGIDVNPEYTYVGNPEKILMLDPGQISVGPGKKTGSGWAGRAPCKGLIFMKTGRILFSYSCALATDGYRLYLGGVISTGFVV